MPTVVREARGAELVGPHLRRAVRRAAGRGRASTHRVIPWDEVADAEGTGIVHIAPGCGQEDFALAKAFDLPVIDPIDEFGVFVDGFGWQTGRVAGATDDPSTDIARDVAADLERKGLLVATEQLHPPLPALLALRHAAHLPPRRRVVHRHGPAARAGQRSRRAT